MAADRKRRELEESARHEAAVAAREARRQAVEKKRLEQEKYIMDLAQSLQDQEREKAAREQAEIEARRAGKPTVMELLDGVRRLSFFFLSFFESVFSFLWIEVSDSNSHQRKKMVPQTILVMHMFSLPSRPTPLGMRTEKNANAPARKRVSAHDRNNRCDNNA